MTNETNKMKNAYDVRKDKELYFVLPEVETDQISEETLKNCAVIVCLYYKEEIPRYLEYIRKIDKAFQVFIITSQKSVIDELDKHRHQLSPSTEFIMKDNRGRDISALLVTSRDYFSRYEYICFIHDKKHKSELTKADTIEWVDDLWDNSLQSAGFAKNVINLFEKNKNLGLLLPPEPLSMYFGGWFKNEWGKNFELTKELCEELGVHVNIERESPPLSLGTVFWCRTCALRKLYSRQWSVEDFPEEPMPNDGTISHAIERSLPYFAQDSGFETGMIMCEKTARHRLAISQYEMKIMYDLLHEYLGVVNLKEINSFQSRKKKLIRYCEDKERIYLFGAGIRSRDCMKMLATAGIHINGLLVTKLSEDDKNRSDAKVISIDDIQVDEGTGIIIAVSEKLKDEMIAELHMRGIDDFCCFT